jgi:hypothetical protein
MYRCNDAYLILGPSPLGSLDNCLGFAEALSASRIDIAVLGPNRCSELLLQCCRVRF